VVVSEPLQRQVADWDDYVGRFEAASAVQVRPRVTGYVQSVDFRDGQYVRKGQVLFVIDPRVYQAALEQARGQQARAQATLQDAQVELTRARALFAARATSQQEVDTRLAAEKQAEADLTAARAFVATAQLNVGFTRVTAPISGKVSDSRAAMPGNLVNQDSTVMTSIVSMDPIRFSFEGPESLFLKYHREASGRREGGTPVQIRLQDEADYRWNGQIAFVDNAIDTGSGTIRAYAVVRNPAQFLTPGMFGHMRLLATDPHAALLVPDQAVVTDLSRQVVYVVSGGVVAQRVVQLGALVDGLRVIRSGLQPTDSVVISGVQRAHPGERVQAVAGRIAPQAASSQSQPDLGPPPGSATFAR
jgi:RND family efflux transporter MFP subunit